MKTTHRKSRDKLREAIVKSSENLDATHEAFELSRSFSAASKGVVTDIIVMCQRLVGAEKALSPVRFDEFCRDQKLSKRSSLFRKCKTVGNNGRRLFEHSYYLPARLDALAECAGLEEDRLEDLIKKGRIHRFITDAELKKVIQSVQPPPLHKKRRKNE